VVNRSQFGKTQDNAMPQQLLNNMNKATLQMEIAEENQYKFISLAKKIIFNIIR
jgi:hypothetical protein